MVEPVVTEERLGQWVAQQEKSGVTVTGSMVADVLGVSASTGRRRLAALRKANQPQPRLRLAGNEESKQTEFDGKDVRADGT